MMLIPSESSTNVKPLWHPGLRPILLGVAFFVIMNLMMTLVVTFSALNARFNFSYGNFLPVKLTRMQEAQPENLDVLFLGTSQTNNGFSTHAFEKAFKAAKSRTLNSFNLGLPNNRYDVMLNTLRLHQRRYGKPKLLLVELSPSIQETDSVYYYLPALYYRTLLENNPALLGDILQNRLISEKVKEELLLSGLSSLRQYRFTFSPVNLLGKAATKMKTLSPFKIPTAQAQTPIYLDSASQAPGVRQEIDPALSRKGWYPKEQSPHMTTPQGLALSVTEARKYYIDAQKTVRFDKLRSLLDYCQSQDIPVVLISWPNHPAFTQVFKKSRLYRDYHAGLGQLQTDYPVGVINLQNYLPDEPSERLGALFADPRHLTPEGAAIFSTVLAQELLKLPESASFLSEKSDS